MDKRYAQALALIRQGDLSYREIAKQCKIDSSQFYDMIEGRAESYGKAGAEFHSELKKIEKELDKEIRKITKSNKKETQYLINKYLMDAKTKTKVSRPLVQTLTSIANALAKSTPKVEIGSLSYTQGISAEELIYEFKRLKGDTEVRPVGRGVQEVAGGGSEEVPVVEARIDPITEKSENPLLPAES